jgi:hypothetical protein
MRFEMRSSSFKSAIAAAAVAAIFAVAPMQLGSPHVFGFAQAQAAARGGSGGHVGGNAKASGVAARPSSISTQRHSSTVWLR